MLVYTRRWSHDDKYTIEMTPKGWHVTQGMIDGDGDRTGFPGLAECFGQDSVSYPAQIGHYFEKIWKLLNANQVSDAQAQAHFDAIGRWVSECEKATPAYIDA